MTHALFKRTGVLVAVCAAVGLALIYSGIRATHADAAPTTTTARDAGNPLSIELAGVPATLTLPMDAKQNELVTATVRGGTPAAVWLAREADSRFSVALQSAGAGQYQVNLADRDILLALQRTGGSGQFHLFVKNPAGAVIQSVPICFELSSPAAAVYFAMSGTNVLANPGGWVHPDQVTTIDVTLSPTLPGVTVTAAAGDQRWQLKQGDEGQYSLEVTPQIRDQWHKSERLRVSVDSPVHTPDKAEFLAIPQTLNIPPGGISMRIMANSAQPIPGSSGYMIMHCSEVASEYAALDVTRADQQRVDPKLRVGDCAAFRLGSHQYAYGPDRIDYAASIESQVVVHIWSGTEAEDRLIRQVIDNVRIDDRFSMTFQKHTYNNIEAAGQLQELYLRSGAKTVSEFLDALNDREKTVGSACRVSACGRAEESFRAYAVDLLSSLGWTPAPVAAAQ